MKEGIEVSDINFISVAWFTVSNALGMSKAIMIDPWEVEERLVLFDECWVYGSHVDDRRVANVRCASVGPIFTRILRLVISLPDLRMWMILLVFQMLGISDVLIDILYPRCFGVVNGYFDLSGCEDV